MALSTNQVIYSTFSIEIYCYSVHDSSISCKKYLESIFRFSHLLIRDLIMEFSPNLSIFSTFSGKMHYQIDAY